jgi:flagellar motor switch protein FliN/FliY
MAVGKGGEPLDQADIDAALAAAQNALADTGGSADEGGVGVGNGVTAAAAPPVFGGVGGSDAGGAAAPLFAPMDDPNDYGDIAPQNLDMVMDIPLELSVELGRKRMSIRQILDLGSGAIVELDKIAGEPVDLLVNGRLVARGEVVVIEDNFGVRITEIVNSAGRGGAAAGKSGD